MEYTDTIELTANERDSILPLVVNVFLNRTENNKAISNAKIRKLLNESGDSITEAQVRKLIYYIRNNNIIELLIAGKDGYFVSNSVDDICSWILRQRGKIKSMQKTLDSIESQYARNQPHLKQGSEVGASRTQISIYDIEGV